jgi:hypothetical protein
VSKKSERRRRASRVWLAGRGTRPAPAPVIVKDLDGRVIAVREAESFKPQPPRAA